MLVELSRLVARAVAEGNLPLARALIDAAQKVEAGGGGAAVVDLASERVKRGVT